MGYLGWLRGIPEPEFLGARCRVEDADRRCQDTCPRILARKHDRGCWSLSVPLLPWAETRLGTLLSADPTECQDTRPGYSAELSRYVLRSKVPRGGTKVPGHLVWAKLRRDLFRTRVAGLRCQDTLSRDTLSRILGMLPGTASFAMVAVGRVAVRAVAAGPESPDCRWGTRKEFRDPCVLCKDRDPATTGLEGGLGLEPSC